MNNNQFRVSHYAAAFSLVELMIVIVIIGILSSIAIPKYQEHVRTAHRAEAQSALLQMAATLEKYRAGHSNYNMPIGSGDDAWFPNQAPLESPTKFYTLSLTIDTTNNDAYSISATPIASTAMNNDYTYALDQTGLRKRTQNGVIENTW